MSLLLEYSRANERDTCAILSISLLTRAYSIRSNLSRIRILVKVNYDLHLQWPTYAKPHPVHVTVIMEQCNFVRWLFRQYRNDVIINLNHKNYDEAIYMH